MIFDRGPQSRILEVTEGLPYPPCLFYFYEHQFQLFIPHEQERPGGHTIIAISRFTRFLLYLSLQLSLLQI